MKSKFAIALVAASSFVAVGLAQDPVKTEKAHYHVLAENAALRVIHVIYQPGDKSAAHSHPESAIVALDAFKVKFGFPDGKSEDVERGKETALFNPAGTHTVTNLGGKFEGILVEFKTPAPGKATIPASRPGLVMKELATGPRGTVMRSTADAKFAEPAGTKHDFDQVVIALNAGEMSLAIDGKPAKTTWKRGDAVIVPRGTAHESKNTGGKPIDFIIVAVK
jgi:quercetin dioxygenase-like cupin family protein